MNVWLLTVFCFVATRMFVMGSSRICWYMQFPSSILVTAPSSYGGDFANNVQPEQVRLCKWSMTLHYSRIGTHKSATLKRVFQYVDHWCNHPAKAGWLVVGVLHPSSIYGLRLVTIHTNENCMTLPHWETRLASTMPLYLTQSHYADMPSNSGRIKPKTYTIDTYCFLARCSALLG